MGKEINEAMGLASMNPMTGSNPHTGSYIVNVMNHDKDLGNDGSVYTGISRSLDMDDNLYGLDYFGRVHAKKKYEVMERPDTPFEVYKINTPNSEEIMDKIIKEADLPYEKRPMHKKSWLFEVFAGKTFFTEDQYKYEPLFEKVELEKMSAGLNGVSQGGMTGITKGLQHKGKKKSDYIPDNDYPSGTENMSNPGYVLAAWEQQGQDLKLLREIKNIKIDLPKDTMYNYFLSENDEEIPKVTTRLDTKGKTKKLSIHSQTPTEDYKKKIKVKNTKNEKSEETIETYSSSNVSLESGLLNLMGINDNKCITKTLLPYKCEIKPCYHTLQGETKDPVPNLILYDNNKRWRVRAELLLFKENKLFLLKQDKMNQYGTF